MHVCQGRTIINSNSYTIAEVALHNVVINGLSRIGRAVLKHFIGRTDLNVKPVNDLVAIANLTYLLRYDSV